jgi:hypothetical protein
MQILNIDNVQIFYESDPQVMVCYRDNSFCGLLKYPKTIDTIYQLRDDARDWYEQWIRPRIDKVD